MDLRQDDAVPALRRRGRESSIRRALGARHAGDRVAIRELFAEDLEFEFVVPRSLTPFGGRVGRDREAFIAALQFESAHFERFDWELLSLHACDETAVARQRILTRNIGTGGAHLLGLCAILTFRQGVVSKFIEYADTYVLNRLMRADADAVF